MVFPTWSCFCEDGDAEPIPASSPRESDACCSAAIPMRSASADTCMGIDEDSGDEGLVWCSNRTPASGSSGISLMVDIPEFLWSPQATFVLDEHSQGVLCVLRRMLLRPEPSAVGEWNGPSLLMDHLLVGSAHDATDLELLRSLRVTHVLNCAAKQVATGSDFYADTDLVYSEFAAEDRRGYDVFAHFRAMEEFVEKARESGGRALVHCYQGVNRSGALCIAYHMLHAPSSLLGSVLHCKARRHRILTNPSFQLQLLELALARSWPLQHYSGEAAERFS